MRRLLALLLACLPQVAGAVDCREVSFEARSFTVCEVSASEDLRLFLNRPDGSTFGSFAAVNGELAASGETLAFAMNAGMFHRDRAPVGLFVEDGKQVTPLVTRAGPGNFGMLPNGVLCWGDGRFRIVESRAFAKAPPSCRWATQSGPMLVIDGALHPRFLPDSDSRYVRNGVGVSGDGRRAVFAISNQPVTFHLFARLFRDGLGIRQALYLDGAISRLFAPQLGRDDFGFSMGPIVGVVVPRG